MAHLATRSAIIVGAYTLGASIALAQSTISIFIAGEAFDGPPAFQMSVGSKVIGSGTLVKAIETETAGRLFSNPRPSRFLEQFSFTVLDRELLPGKPISVLLTNDKYADDQDGLDRNLFIDRVVVNGLEMTSADLVLMQGTQAVQVQYQAGLLPIYEAGQRVVANAPAGGWPAEQIVPAGAAEELLFSSPQPRLVRDGERAAK
jgi:hypothetical protein